MGRITETPNHFTLCDGDRSIEATIYWDQSHREWRLGSPEGDGIFCGSGSEDFLGTAYQIAGTLKMSLSKERDELLSVVGKAFLFRRYAGDEILIDVSSEEDSHYLWRDVTLPAPALNILDALGIKKGDTWCAHFETIEVAKLEPPTHVLQKRRIIIDLQCRVELSNGGLPRRLIRTPISHYSTALIKSMIKEPRMEVLNSSQSVELIDQDSGEVVPRQEVNTIKSIPSTDRLCFVTSDNVTISEVPGAKARGKS